MSTTSVAPLTRRQRTSRIRRRVVAGVLGLFALTTGVITLQLTSGHDPVLTAQAAKRTAAPSGGQGGLTSLFGGSGGPAGAANGYPGPQGPGGGDSGGGGYPGGGVANSGPAPGAVTSRQS